MFGLGGIYVEVLKDVSFRIAPLTDVDASEMITEISSFPLLAGVRGQKRADIESITDILLRVSNLVMDFPEINEMDINPLMVGTASEGSIAVDARILLGGK
jgi:acyl-CoA synthetase (NDP forming)